MRLAISNIAWTAADDAAMLSFVAQSGLAGLEIAPTRIFPEQPYADLGRAKTWADELRERYGLCVPSMQSIWYGRTEKIFGDSADRERLIDYTRRAILFAEAIGCPNLVFGNPRNRDTDDVAAARPVALEFFRRIGDFAAEHGTVIALEPNPPIYSTRFMNRTGEAAEIAAATGCEGVKVNVDLGTIIENGEDIEELRHMVPLINHVHISEPYLAPVERRPLHRRLFILLAETGYDRFVSIEMGAKTAADNVKSIINYITDTYNDASTPAGSTGV